MFTKASDIPIINDINKNIYRESPLKNLLLKLSE